MGRRRPKKASESEAGFLFPVGAEVEVRSDDPGFKGSFYEATVAGHLSANRYTLAYSTLLAEDGGALKETAAAADVRPRPPPPPPQGNAGPREFAVYDMVEAFHNDRWWAGVVSAVPSTGDRRQQRLYSVTFPASRETTEFAEAALRPHRVFQDGLWVPAAEAAVDNVSPLFCEGNQVEVSLLAKNVGRSWIPATVLKVIGATNVLVQYMHIENNGSWRPGVIVEVLGSGIDKKYAVKLKNHERDVVDVDCAGVLTVEDTQLRPRYDWDGKRWVLYLKEKSAKGPRLNARKRRTSTVLALYDKCDKLRPGSCRDNKKLKKADVVSESISLILPEETMEQRNVVLALGSPLSLPSLPPKAALGHLSSSSLAPSCHLEQSSQMISPFLGTRSRSPDWSKIVLTDQDKQATLGSGTDLSREKGKCAAFQTPVAAGEITETEKKVIAAITIEENDDITVAQLPSDMTAGCEIPSRIHTGSYIDLTPRSEIGGSEESPTKDFPDSGESIEKSEIPSVGMSNCTETEPGNSLALAIQDLPFVKTFPLWAELEALEIFRKVPQRPHFLPLQQHPPEIREGMAFGLMLSFAKLAESINRLGGQDESGLLEEKMLGLSLLEANGFDVRDLKSRLEALLDAKNSRVKLQDALNRLQEIIAKKETDDRELSAQIRMLAMVLHHIELDVCLIRNEMRSAIAERVTNSMEISGLKEEANEP